MSRLRAGRAGHKGWAVGGIAALMGLVQFKSLHVDILLDVREDL
jgi:hypothetical protein